MEHFRISNLLDIYSSGEYNNISQKALIDFSKEYIKDKEMNQLEYIKTMQEQCKALYMLSMDSLLKLEEELKQNIIKDIPQDDLENKYSVQKIRLLYKSFTGKEPSRTKFSDAKKSGKLRMIEAVGSKDYVYESDLLEYMKSYDNLLLTPDDLKKYIYIPAKIRRSF